MKVPFNINTKRCLYLKKKQNDVQVLAYFHHRFLPISDFAMKSVIFLNNPGSLQPVGGSKN